jgi:4-alpha-glucanotransferase
MKNRGSGILLHITSLPSAYGIGDLGPMPIALRIFLRSAAMLLANFAAESDQCGARQFAL